MTLVELVSQSEEERRKSRGRKKRRAKERKGKGKKGCRMELQKSANKERLVCTATCCPS